MTVMTIQPPLPLIPAGATEIGAAAAMIEDDDGGRVFVHGNLAFAWDAGDTAGRRFAAVSLMRIKAATQVQVAAAFDTSPLTVWRWAQAVSEAGVSALVPHRKGPRRASKLTAKVIATIAVLREQGLSVQMHAGGASLKAQFKKADASRARYALVFGQDEVAAGQVAIKPLRAEAQAQYTRPLHDAAGWAHELRTA